MRSQRLFFSSGSQAHNRSNFQVDTGAMPTALSGHASAGHIETHSEITSINMPTQSRGHGTQRFVGGVADADRDD